MRIIGGIHRGRQFHPPHLDPTRPTTDFAKEALFNILQNNWEFEDVKFLDLFAGTGAHSYEFASRGSTDVTTIDMDYQCAAFIKKTAEQFELKQIKVINMDVFKFIQNCTEQYDIIFAGPPYPLKTLNTIPDLIFEKNMLKPEGWLIMEHNPKHDFQQHPHFFHQRKYGTTIFAMFR
jgi:16S rRNA (guanine966-N2)-methyltransferase